jgi:hypothetical protein
MNGVEGKGVNGRRFALAYSGSTEQCLKCFARLALFILFSLLSLKGGGLRPCTEWVESMLLAEQS